MVQGVCAGLPHASCPCGALQIFRFWWPSLTSFSSSRPGWYPVGMVVWGNELLSFYYKTARITAAATRNVTRHVQLSLWSVAETHLHVHETCKCEVTIPKCNDTEDLQTLGCLDDLGLAPHASNPHQTPHRVVPILTPVPLMVLAQTRWRPCLRPSGKSARSSKTGCHLHYRPQAARGSRLSSIAYT